MTLLINRDGNAGASRPARVARLSPGGGVATMLPNRLTLWIARRVRARMEALARRRPADIAIGGAANPYMLRWYVIPRNRFFNIYLHEVRRSDDDRALHDHPWASISLMLRGRMDEVVRTRRRDEIRAVREGMIVVRRAACAHRLEYRLDDPSAPLTLFVTGPKTREWGFHCPNGWRHWRVFTGGERGEVVGRGCD